MGEAMAMEARRAGARNFMVKFGLVVGWDEVKVY
jgi:hypothetical protein